MHHSDERRAGCYDIANGIADCLRGQFSNFDSWQASKHHIRHRVETSIRCTLPSRKTEGESAPDTPAHLRVQKRIFSPQENLVAMIPVIQNPDWVHSATHRLTHGEADNSLGPPSCRQRNKAVPQ